MAMFLMVACMSLLALAVTLIAFAGATRAKPDQAPAPRPSLVPELAVPQRFFADALASQPTVPPEVLLAQIEQHIRLELAAAESFIERPTQASLHGRTTSPFVN